MTNVSVDGPIMIFRNESPDRDEPACAASPEYLWSRELSERAAAKKAEDVAARRVHQELAILYAEQRRGRGRSISG